MTTDGFLDDRERFLPIKQAALLRRALQHPHLSEQERERFKTLHKMLQLRFHVEFYEQLARLRTVYDPFDPDRDTLPLAEWASDQREAMRAELIDGIRTLLNEGNYVEMTHDQLIRCLELQTFGGVSVKVDLNRFEELHVHYRGVRQEQRTRRSPATLWRKRTYNVRVLKRVAVLVREDGRQNDTIRLKLFKDVVVGDLKMVSPNVRIQMRLLDKLKVGSSVAGGLSAPTLKLLMAAAISPLLMLLLAAGFLGAFVKGIFSFLSSKTKYMQTLSSSLYFQNLANNMSALTQLVDAADAEEAKELLLAYFILHVDRDRNYTVEELDRRVEQWLGEEFGLDVDFEVGDAVRKLREKGLVVTREVPAGQHRPGEIRRVLKVYDLPSSLRKLDQVWDGYFTWNEEHSADQDRIADAHWPPPAALARGQQTGTP